tara:strand:+ start:554 stop:901 length:348 start_codon:yes stop_codon:yes gene_type:complete
MATRLMSGYERTNRIRLPEGKTRLSPKDPIGAAAMGAVVRVMNRANTMDEIGNILTLQGSVGIEDNTKTVIGVRETFVYVDSNGVEHKTEDHNTAALFKSEGMTFVRCDREDIMG